MTIDEWEVLNGSNRQTWDEVPGQDLEEWLPVECWVRLT